MDGQPTTAEPPYHYQQLPWQSPAIPLPSPALNVASDASPGQFPSAQFEIFPFLYPQQNRFQAQLLEYNKLVSPGRGGGGGGGSHSSPVSPGSASANHSGTRSRSSSKVLSKENSQAKSSQPNGHGHKPTKNNDSSDRDRAHIGMGKESLKMSSKNVETQQFSLPSRPSPPTTSEDSSTTHTEHTPLHSSSVPSTPHQHARKYSFESRDPSPAHQNPSPRSAYSETNGNVPSLRPLPPRYCRFETAMPHSRRRMPYSLGTDRLEKVDLDKIKDKLSPEEDKKLSGQIRDLYVRLLPTPDVEKNRTKLVAKLERLFNEEWPGHDIRVHLFGSSGNKLCSDDSDVDICITTEWKDMECVCLIADLLSRRGMEKVVCVSSAKVPIVKIWDPELRLACDMNVNNTLALENTRMVRTYVELDKRIRPLAMVIKYWTRRRIVNDAAFGGTLSSYTWICMIIAFLQLREQPVLPALHQRDDAKLKKKDGRKSEFGDDLEKLSGFGKDNKDTVGALLFQFFRFYAHEFDYDKYVLSIRKGQLITKTEKAWHITNNNMLCVEEPFNTVRNLGNTADDTSFRGLHQELRRAFDLLAEGKFEECCEQYEYPKEEERIFQKPHSRPAIIRSSSQHHQSGRGGRGGYRGGGRQQFHRNNNGNNGNGSNSRRASSVVSVPYETNPSAAFVQGAMPTSMAQDILWYPTQTLFPQDVYPSVMTTTTPESLRMQMYQQQQVLATQMMQGATTQATDRSRTNSLDNPPLTAPIRPEMMVGFGYPMQGTAFYTSQGGFTYPSSPSTTASSASGMFASGMTSGMASGFSSDFRRTLHRGTVTSETGAVTSSGTGAPRSQSQPASRTPMPVTQVIPPYGGQPMSQAMSSYGARQAGNIPISFTSDEAPDAEYDEVTPRPLTDSPPDDEPGYLGYYLSDSAGAARKPSVLAFGDIGQLSQLTAQPRRRPSVDHSPQSILDRRMKRTSRSPSPLGHGHARAFSVGTSSAPHTSVPPFTPSGSKPPMWNRGPPVVNGSGAKGVSSSSTSSTRKPSISDTATSDDTSFDNALHINQALSASGQWLDSPIVQKPASAEHSPSAPPSGPIVVNGSTGSPYYAPAHARTVPDPASFQQRVSMMTSSYHGVPYANVVGDRTGYAGFVPSSQGRQQTSSRQQQSRMAPLDLATNEFSVAADLHLQHLSPVYENRTPSPNVTRKFEPIPLAAAPNSRPGKDSRKEKNSQAPPPLSSGMSRSNPNSPPLPLRASPPTATLPSMRSQDSTRSPVTTPAQRDTGALPRPAKAQGDQSGTWQKAKTRKKAPAELTTGPNTPSRSEQPPKDDADRKGG